MRATPNLATVEEGPTDDRGATVLGGSWVVVSGVISRVTIVLTYIRGLTTPLITTHEPPSRVLASAGHRSSSMDTDSRELTAMCMDQIAGCRHS